MKVEVARFTTLAESQAHARRKVDEAAEAVRIRYLTPGSGQALEYEAAHREAERRLQGIAGTYPMLQADVDAGLAVDLDDAATLVVQTRAQWETLGAVIRTIRLGAKHQIGQAQTQADVAQLRDGAIAQLESL